MSKKEISEDEVRYIALLSRLHVTDDEVKKLQSELGNILGHVDILNTVDVSDIEPLSHVHDVCNVMRHDIVHQFEGEKILKGTPDSSGTYIRTPLVIDGGE